jgi:phage gp36-like protein
VGTQYVTAAELRSYVNAAAIVDIEEQDVTRACIAASEKADSYFRGRYPLPFTAYGEDVKMHVAWIAVYIALRQRGYNPAQDGTADPIRQQFDDAVMWLEGVQRQSIHPDVTYNSPSPPNYQLPTVRSAQARGW